MSDYINENPKSTRIDKPVESLIQYQGRDTVLDITIDEQTELMEVYRDQKNHVTLKPLNDSTKENKLEIVGPNTDLLKIAHGENGTDETTKLAPVSDFRKENTIEPIVSSAGNMLSSITHGTNRTDETSKLKVENDSTKEQVLESKESVTGNNLIGLEKGENGTSDTTKIFGINDNTKEQVLEVSGTEQEKKLITLEKGTNGTTETTKITVHSDDSKENKLTFQTGTPDTVGITRVGNIININVNNSGGEPTQLNFSTDTPDLLDVSRDNANIKINAFHDSTKQGIFTASTETSNLIEVKQEKDKLIINGKSDNSKENILTFNTTTPDTINITKSNDTVTINNTQEIPKYSFNSNNNDLLEISESDYVVNFTPKHDNEKQDVLNFTTNTPNTVMVSKADSTVTIDVTESESTNVIFSVIDNDRESNIIRLYANTSDTSKYFVLHSHSGQSGGTIIKPLPSGTGTTYEISNPYDNTKNKITISYGDNSPTAVPYQYFDFTYMDYINPNIVTYSNFNPVPSKNIMNQSLTFSIKGKYTDIGCRVGNVSVNGFELPNERTVWNLPTYGDEDTAEFYIIETNEIIKTVPITVENQLYGLGGLNMYNVGDIYLSTTTLNPSNLYGGKWEFVCQGRTLVGVSLTDSDFNAAGKTGGQKTQKFKYGIIYSPYYGTAIGNDAGMIRTAVYNGTTDTGNFRNSSSFKTEYTIGNNSLVDYSKNLTSSTYKNTGETSEENIMNPYYTVYIWKRIS